MRNVRVDSKSGFRFYLARVAKKSAKSGKKSMGLNIQKAEAQGKVRGDVKLAKKGEYTVEATRLEMLDGKFDLVDKTSRRKAEGHTQIRLIGSKETPAIIDHRGHKTLAEEIIFYRYYKVRGQRPRTDYYQVKNPVKISG
jgi:hypothetical protein